MNKVKCTSEEIASIRASLIDRSVPVHKRFRIIFTLRNIEGPEAIDALAAGEKQLGNTSPLFFAVAEFFHEHFMNSRNFSKFLKGCFLLYYSFSGFDDESALLKHEIAFVMGNSQKSVSLAMVIHSR